MNDGDQTDPKIKAAFDAVHPDPDAPARTVAALVRRRSKDLLVPAWWTAGAGLAGFALAYFGQGAEMEATSAIADGTALLFGGLQ
ncbi:hypothetical protein AAD018_003260 [Aestuariibius insulae]|uniref:hypothetical protein n=1 Tax=Aestuariibius insulae TaxID=2058287 RepID=UPI00345E46E8